jgi:hypothetical protein
MRRIVGANIAIGSSTTWPHTKKFRYRGPKRWVLEGESGGLSGLTGMAAAETKVSGLVHGASIISRDGRVKKSTTAPRG